MSGAVQAMLLSGKAAVQVDADPLWANVKLALHFDGTNGSTAFVDQKAHTLTRLGTPTITTAQSKFGGASGQFSNGGITVGNDVYNADFDLGTADFTVRFWMRPTSSAADMAMFDCRSTGGDSGGFVIWLSGTALAVYCGVTYYTQDSVAMPLNAWTHVEVCRVSGLLYTFKGGVAITSALPFTENLNDGRCFVGQANTGAGGGFFMVGQIDDLQVVKGQGLHTANFTPPAVPFPDS